MNVPSGQRAMANKLIESQVQAAQRVFSQFGHCESMAIVIEGDRATVVPHLDVSTPEDKMYSFQVLKEATVNATAVVQVHETWQYIVTGRTQDEMQKNFNQFLLMTPEQKAKLPRKDVLQVTIERRWEVEPELVEWQIQSTVTGRRLTAMTRRKQKAAAGTMLVFESTRKN